MIDNNISSVCVIAMACTHHNYLDIVSTSRHISMCCADMLVPKINLEVLFPHTLDSLCFISKKVSGAVCGAQVIVANVGVKCEL